MRADAGLELESGDVGRMGPYQGPETRINECECGGYLVVWDPCGRWDNPWEW